MENVLKFYKKKDEQNKFIVSNDKIDKEEYIELKANVEDAAIEKHLPKYSIENDTIKVVVGSILHPMTEDHYIMWIAQVVGDKVNMVKLTPNSKPETEFSYVKDSEIYAYCNLHGLWKTEVK